MKILFLLLLVCHVSAAVKHNLHFFFSGLSGVSNFPQCSGTALVDDFQISYCDSNRVKINRGAGNKLFNDDPQLLQFYAQNCAETQPDFFKDRLNALMLHFNQFGGVYILQLISGCEWDENTGDVVGVFKHGYDGEDFISLDMTNLTWIPLKPEAVAIKEIWDDDKDEMKGNKNFYTQLCPRWLKMFVNYEKTFPLQTDPPSVSLLQKSPSSPVSCHATGFYPDRATMFWRKDGEEIHEDVDKGEILPNTDGTFQMNVDLNIMLSSLRIA